MRFALCITLLLLAACVGRSTTDGGVGSDLGAGGDGGSIDLGSGHDAGPAHDGGTDLGSVDLGGDTSCPACPGVPPGCRVVMLPPPCGCGTYVCDDAGPRPDLGTDGCVPTGACLTDRDCACGFCYAGICS